MKYGLILLALISFTSCNTSYHYSSEKEESKLVKETLIYPNIDFVQLGGALIFNQDVQSFTRYLQEELGSRSFTYLDKSSEYKLYIYTKMQPIETKRYKDKFLGADNYHVSKKQKLKADYELKDKMGKLIWSDSYELHYGTSKVSENNYREAEAQISVEKIRQHILKSLAEDSVDKLIEHSKEANK